MVKAFNTTFAGYLVAGQAGGAPLDVFIAGDDAGARQAVADLAASGGLRPIDAARLIHSSAQARAGATGRRPTTVRHRRGLLVCVRGTCKQHSQP